METPCNLPWNLKYLPQKQSEIFDNHRPIKKIYQWMKNEDKGVLYLKGPHGIGKTSILQFLGKKSNIRLYFLTWEDLSPPDAKQRKLKAPTLMTRYIASTQPSLLGVFRKGKKSQQEKCILVIDNLQIYHDGTDRLSQNSINYLVNYALGTINNQKSKGKKTKDKLIPIQVILIGNLEYHSFSYKFTKNNKILQIEFQKSEMCKILPWVKDICKKEQIHQDNDMSLRKIIVNCQYDVRKILITLQDLHRSYHDSITVKDTKKYQKSIAKANQYQNIFTITQNLFQKYSTLPKIYLQFKLDSQVSPMIYANYPSAIWNRQGAGMEEKLIFLKIIARKMSLIEKMASADKQTYFKFQSAICFYQCSLPIYLLHQLGDYQFFRMTHWSKYAGRI